MNNTALLVLTALIAAGCSSSSNTTSSGESPTDSNAKSTSATASEFTPEVGQDAALIASHIPNLTHLAAGSVAKGGPSMTSSATCTLLGHIVIIDSFSSASETATMPELLKDNKTPTFVGDIWTRSAMRVQRLVCQAPKMLVTCTNGRR